MNKVLIVDPLSYSGHVNYNHGIIRAISKSYDYDIIVNESVADKLTNKGIDNRHFIETYPDEWNIVELSKRMNKFFYHIAFRYYFIKLIFKIAFLKKDYDAIIITCIDIFAFSLVSWLLGDKVYVVDHGIGLLANSRAYRIAWKLTCSKINLIVLEEFIKEMASKLLKNRKIYVVKHPLPAKINIIKPTEKDTSGHIILFGPSGSNDESFLESLRKAEIPDDIKIVAKSHILEIKNDNLILYKNYVSDEDYLYYLNMSKYLLLAYPSSYNYRISAVLFEALRMQKPVLLYANNTLVHYQKIFPGQVCLFNSVNDLFEKMRVFTPKSSNDELNSYSDEELAQSINKMLNA